MSLKIINSKLKIVIVALFLFATMLPFSKAEAAWLTGWANRRAVTINNSAGGALTNYQVSVNTTTAIYDNTSLIGSWHFNDGSGTLATDSSGALNMGSLVNTPTWASGASCKFGSCLSFNGSNQSVSVPDIADWSFSGDFTIATWIKWTGTPGATSIMGQDQGGGTVPKWILGWNNTVASKVSFHIQTAGVNISWTWTPSADTWYHMAITRSGNNWYLYINGLAVDSPQTNSTAIPSISAPLTIGSDGEAWKYFYGTLDELRIYSRALSVSEISDLYYGSKARPDYGDVRFTNDDGSTLIDHWQESDKKYWVEVPSISASSQKTVYMYYGKSDATSASNGANTFDFFDDFSVDLSKWTNPCSATIVSGYMNIPSSGGSCDSTPMYANSLTLSDASGYYFDFTGRFSSGGSGRLQIYQRRRAANGYMARFWLTGTATTYYQEFTPTTGSNTNIGANNALADTWYKYSNKVNGSNNSLYINDALIGSIASTASLYPFTDFTVGLGEYLTTVQYDDVRVRKYTATEPTITIQPLIVDCGLRFFDATSIVIFGCEPLGTLGSALRVAMGGNIYGVKLVDTTDSSASKFRIKTSSGTKAIAKLSSSLVGFVSCGDYVVYGGEIYPTVQLGTQCWFAKDLNVGTQITSGTSQGTDCSSTSAIKKYCYGNVADNCSIYGGEYQWTMAMCGGTAEMAQGICPTGWHVPKDPEWVTLTNYLGGTSCGTYRTGNSNVCGGPAGDRMKKAGLCYGRTPCGDSGFNALFGGADSANMGYQIIWWTSSPNANGTEAWRANLGATSAYLNGQDVTGVDGTYYYSPRTSGRHIRCVKN